MLGRVNEAKFSSLTSLVRAEGLAEAAEKGFCGRPNLVRVAGSIERNVFFVTREDDVGSFAIGFSKIFGFGPDHGTLHFRGVHINHVVRRIDDAGLNHDEEFLPLGVVGGRAE